LSHDDLELREGVEMTTNELWEFMPSDDRLDDELETSPEEDAMSIVDPYERATGLSDPGRREVDVGEPDGNAPLALFADEEGAPDRWADRDFDVAELLEVQHYALGADQAAEAEAVED
jgi:hypothetical protein